MSTTLAFVCIAPGLRLALAAATRMISAWRG